MKSYLSLVLFLGSIPNVLAGFANCAHGRLRSITTSYPSNTTILSWVRPVGVQCGKFSPICFCFDAGVVPPLYTEAFVPNLPMMEFKSFDYALSPVGEKIGHFQSDLPTMWHVSWFTWGEAGKPEEIVVEAIEGGRV